MMKPSQLSCLVAAALGFSAVSCSSGGGKKVEAYALSDRTEGHLSALTDTVCVFFEYSTEVADGFPAMVDSVVGMMTEASGGRLLNAGRASSSGKSVMKMVVACDTLALPLYEKAMSASGKPYVECQIMDALRCMTDTDIKNVAFVEGHGEYGGPAAESVVGMLANYYNVYRGRLDVPVRDLQEYDVLIIAGPVAPFTEKEKYVLDQYMMNGGRLFLLLDGFRFSEEMLDVSGESPTIYNDVNLSDLLFAYGVRVNGDMVMDKRCLDISLSRKGGEESYTLPWYYFPVLGSTEALSGRYLLKSEYVSSIDFIEVEGQKQTALLKTSPQTHIQRVPDPVSLEYAGKTFPDDYFSDDAPVVAASLHEGHFVSAFCDRVLPDSVSGGFISETDHGAMIVCSSSSVIANSYDDSGDGWMVYPAGYDLLSGKKYDNLGFVLWCVDYLAGKSDWTYTSAGCNGWEE